MEDKRKILLNKAEERGYSVHSFSSDKKIYNLIKRDNLLGLILYIETEEFQLYYNIDLIVKLESGKAGSFMNDDHFARQERFIEKYLNKVTN